MSGPKWGGRRAQQWKRDVLARYGLVCALRYPGICTHVATTGDHKIPRSVRLDLQYDLDNGQPACLPCNIHRKAAPLAVPHPVDARTFFDSAKPE